MKKLTLLLLIAILLTACGPKPQDVANSWQVALNQGDIDAALSYLADDATVTIIPPAEGDGVYNGHAEIRGWYETIAAGKGSGALRDCTVEGETVTCISKYADEGLKGMGVDFIEGSWVATIRDGKIQSYTFTITPESLAKFPPPPEPTPAPVEELASSVNDLIGIWLFSVKLELKIDGTSRVYFGSDTSPELIDEGTYAFDDGKITWTAGGACKDPATYEAYVTKEDGKPTWLHLQVVGSDSCKDRADMLSRPGKFHAPSIASIDPLAKQVEGVYLTTITKEDAAASPGIETDVYSLKLQTDLRWFIGTPQDPSWVAAQGYYRITEDQIEFKTTGGAVAGDCIEKTGAYKWTLNGGTLTLTLVNDDCGGNKFLFTTHPLVRLP